MATMTAPDPSLPPSTSGEWPAAPPPPAPANAPRHRLRWIAGGAGALVLAVALFAGGVAADRAGLVPFAQPPSNQAPADLALIDQAWNLLHQDYVDRSTLDSKQMAYAAIDAMTQAVGDTGHTSFETPTELAAEQSALSGSYAGIGAVMDTENGAAVVVSVFHGSPAESAGVRSGDQVISIDGTTTDGLSLATVAARIRGPAGTTVTLVLRASGATADRTVHVQRAKITIPVVTWAMVPGTHIADIALAEFSTGATDALKAAIADARKAGATALILDLRGNPGGYVGEAVGVASQFLASGVVYQTEDASGTTTKVSVKPGGTATTIPLVVIVDHSTASAAEIVAGALQDAHRASMVGETTFGTGTVLNQYTLADGSALRIGTEKWLTPSGNEIWHHGITPGHVVALASGVSPVAPDQLKTLGAAGLAGSKDAQLLEAISLLK
jgi:carboxyl-terminal processing protease